MLPVGRGAPPQVLRAGRRDPAFEATVERRVWGRGGLEHSFEHTGWRPAYALAEEYALVDYVDRWVT